MKNFAPSQPKSSQANVIFVGKTPVSHKDDPVEIELEFSVRTALRMGNRIRDVILCMPP